MPRSVRDMRDLPLLYAVKGEEDMGAPKKTRAELLDKIIQFIWDYQDRHNGETPHLNVVEKHVGLGAAGGYYIAILVDEGRLNRIGSRPFRVTINENNKANQRAIASFKRIRERIEAADARERERIREQQGQLQETEQREQDHKTALSLVGQPAVSDTVVAETRAPRDFKDHPEDWNRAEPERKLIPDWTRAQAPPHAEPDRSNDRLTEFTDAHSRVREINSEVKKLMPRLLKISDERDLVYELVSRGYRVDKVR